VTNEPPRPDWTSRFISLRPSFAAPTKVGAITFQFCSSYCRATIPRFFAAGGLLLRQISFHITAESIARDLVDAHLQPLKMSPVVGVDFGDQPPQTIPRTEDPFG
jgi:hypothetical protein